MQDAHQIAAGQLRVPARPGTAHGAQVHPRHPPARSIHDGQPLGLATRFTDPVEHAHPRRDVDRRAADVDGVAACAQVRYSGFLADPTVFRRFSGVLIRATGLVAGPPPDLAATVRASQAIAVLADPIAMYADAPPEQLCREILRGADLLLEPPG
ncbi:hypothetical protein [Pseudonocardia sp. GCM10023141]|uniref:hypothetical protein n=1 Tax=Pseudonocardia sp. GCM10023141 TaxID=3252653 RepID=UPI00361CB146